MTQIAGGGAYVRVLLDCGFPLVALVTRRSLDELGITVGTGIASTFKATAPHLIRRDRIA